MPVVQIKDLKKTYTIGSMKVHALKGIDVNIEKGSYIAIMGPSGSGKSTLLNILGCLDTPTAGRYVLADEDISTLDDDRLSAIRGKHIGFIFQSYNLIPQLNIIENIQVPMHYQGTSEVQSADRAAELAELVGLSDRVNHRPPELSGGQQQRVAIARALANDPLFILADEPTGNLDSKSGAEILEILENLNRNGKTLIMVTHDDDIAKRAHYVIRLLDGKIERTDNNHNNGQ
jgi:putative ABC transport system ATP-binding protein